MCIFGRRVVLEKASNRRLDLIARKEKGRSWLLSMPLCHCWQTWGFHGLSHSAISNCGCDCDIVCVIVLCSGDCDCVRERERERAILSDWT